MKRHVLLIDFGATRIKSALLNLDTGSYGLNHVSPGSSAVGQIVPMSFFANALIEHIGCSVQTKISAIIICCEMHGFTWLTDIETPERKYVSWRYSTAEHTSTIEKFNQLNFRDVTGLNPRSGLPAVTLLAESSTKLNKDSADSGVSFLPDEICRQLGHSNNVAHVTLAHSSGLYTRNNEPISGFGLEEFLVPAVSNDDLVELGYVKVANSNIPCFGGYGDLQASVYGASPDYKDWVINLGTGSQVISQVPVRGQEFELRKYFHHQEISCVTHIPAGRTLTVFADFFKEVRQAQTADYFWNMLASVDPLALPTDAPIFDLAVFREARGYKNGGSVQQINEHAFDTHHFFAGLLNSFLGQYLKLLSAEDPKETRRVLLAGNMAKSLPNIRQWFEANWSAPVSLTSGAPDPTFDCMAKFATNLLPQRL